MIAVYYWRVKLLDFSMHDVFDQDLYGRLAQKRGGQHSEARPVRAVLRGSGSPDQLSLKSRAAPASFLDGVKL
jgi:hypothetical protein